MTLLDTCMRSYSNLQLNGYNVLKTNATFRLPATLLIFFLASNLKPTLFNSNSLLYTKGLNSLDSTPTPNLA